MANHAVVRTDLMAGTDVRSELVSIKYLGEDGATPTEIDNGNILKVGALIDGEREVHVGSAPASTDELSSVVLVASVEEMYDERLRNLSDFYNEADKICRGYVMHSRDIFSVTAEALDGTPAVGESVTLGDGTKLVVGGAGTAVGTIIEEDTVNSGRYTYYVIRVN